MKRIYKIFSVALVALGAISCQVEEMEIEKGQMIQENGEYVLVTAGLPSNNTKVSYEMDAANNLVKTAWEKGDVIYRTTGSSGTAFTQKDSISADGKFANFEANLNLSANTNYLFTYPVQYRNSSGGNLRIQNMDGTLETAMACDYLYGVARTDANKVLANINFKRLTSFLQIKDVDFGTGVNGTVKVVYFTGATVGNRAMINMNSGDTYGVPSVYRDRSVVIVPSEYNIADGKPENTEPLYIAFMPVTESNESEKASAKGDEYTLTFVLDNGDTYVKTWKSSTAYTSGNMYSISCDLEKPMVFNIQFEEDIIRKKLIYYGYDMNADSLISNIEASLMTTLGWVFAEDKNITKFNEFQYFTGITYMDANRSGSSGAFYGCTSLKEITLPASLTVIGSDSFNGCTSLEKFVVPETVKKINAGAFRYCSSLKEITIPETVTYMGSGLTFANCTSLKTVKWPKGTTNIPSQAFFESGLEEFVINDNVTSIDASAFARCFSLKEIKIPASVQTIAMKAFYECTGITSFEIPSGVKTIGNEAFYGTGAKSFSLPATVTSIGENAFGANSKITSFTIESGSPYSVSEDVSILIKGTEAVAFFGNKASITFPDNVTKIGNKFAYGSTVLESVNIPAVTSFGNNTFTNCTNLKTAVFAAGATTTGNNTFNGCTSLTSVTLPTAITELGTGLFQNCSSLKNIEIPDGVTKINNNVFMGCSSLESVTLPSTLKEIAQNLFNGCAALKSINIPTSVTKIGNSAFAGCTSLTELVLPSTITTIPAAMIQNCTGIKSIELPESVTTINSNAFRGSGLTSFTFPPKVTVINSIFAECKDLKSVTIPSTIKTIQMSAFEGTGLESITIPEHITSLPMWAFKNCTNLVTVDMPGVTTLSGQSIFEGCTSLKTVNMPKVKTMSALWMFKDCKALESITIPEGVTALPNQGFIGCSSLKDVKLPSTITALPTFAFQHCTSLKSITIPAKVTSYGSQTFVGCTALEEVIIENPTPSNIGTGVFPFATNENLVIYVPDAALEAYKAHASWSADEYKGRIYGISTRE